MARNDNKLPRASKDLKTLASSIQDTTDNIYAQTYNLSKSNRYDLETLRSGIDKSLDSIMQYNRNFDGRPNISGVYTRMFNNERAKSTITLSNGQKVSSDDFTTLFEDKDLMDSAAELYAANTYIKRYDEEIDLICKYMPKLEEAIEVKKDTVLFADQFNKDYLSVRAASSIAYSDTALHSEIELLKEKYDLLNLCEDSVYETWKYGEQFLYIVPYRKALKKVLDRRKMTQAARGYTVINQSNIMHESISIDYDKINESSTSVSAKTIKATKNLDIEFNMDFALSESIQNMCTAVDKFHALNEEAVNESIYNVNLTEKQIEAIEEANKSSDMTFSRRTKLSSKKIIPDDTVPGDIENFSANSTYSDGTIDVSKKDAETNIDLSNCPGCLVKKLERSKVLPIYIETMCMGYYYIEVMNDAMTGEQNANFTTYMDFGQKYGKKLAQMAAPNNDPLKTDSVLKKIVQQMSDLIDEKFINANQDLSRELYMILKYDENFNETTSKVRITYIPPEDMQHIYFKMNPKTHRGLSLLDKALIPAKIYISLYMSYAIGMLTRGHDKRVYYVKQQVETNISKTLLNAIQQIKKGNFGVRNMENLMNVLNITGMYNDLFIPRSASGESPIDFEVMQGQDFNPNMDFLQQFEDYAIGTTGVPIELISSRQSVDYALQLTMTSSKHIRIVFKDQAKIQRIFGKLLTTIYNAEFQKKMVLTVLLPPPLYISMTNTSQLVQNVSDYCDKVIEPTAKSKGLDDDAIAKAKVLYMRQALGTYMDMDMIDEIIERAKIQKTDPTQNSDEE